MEIPVFKNDNSSYFLNFSSDVFGLKYNENLVYQLIMSFQKNIYKNNIKKQKSRGLVSGGGKKPWKQKGTGRARVGSIRSPLWRGGGKIFASTGDIKSKKKINKKVYKLGIKIIFSELIRSNKIMLIENINILTHKTCDFLNLIKFLNLKSSTLFIVDYINLYLRLSSRNLKNFSFILYNRINPIILLKFNQICITVSAMKLIEEFYL